MFSVDNATDKSGIRQPLDVQSSSSEAEGIRHSTHMDKLSTQPSPHMIAQVQAAFKSKNWMQEVLEVVFRCDARKSSLRQECFAGFIQYISGMYVLTIIPAELHNAGYNKTSSFAATTLVTAIACILSGIVTNLPFVLGPPTVLCIFLSKKMQQDDMTVNEGDVGVVLSGLLLILCGWKPLGQMLTKLMPHSVQVGTAVGIGLLSALAGAVNVGLVEAGEYTLLDSGEVSDEVLIAGLGFIVVIVALYYDIKGAFLLSMCIASVLRWCSNDSFPTSISTIPTIEEIGNFSSDLLYADTWRAALSLIFLYLLTTTGLLKSLGSASGLIRSDGSLSRNRWIFFVCGLATVISGCISGPPIIISADSIAGIRAGGKTGLSTVICGFLFLLSIFFAPIFSAIPPAATAPILITIGLITFINVTKINWRNIREAATAFVVLFFVPFTYSTIIGVVYGYVVYLVVGICTGEIYYDALELWGFYYAKVINDDDPISHSKVLVYGTQKERNRDYMDHAVDVDIGLFDSTVLNERGRPYFPTQSIINDRLYRRHCRNPAAVDDCGEKVHGNYVAPNTLSCDGPKSSHNV